MAIEIVSFPIKNGGFFHSYVNVYQAGYIGIITPFETGISAPWKQARSSMIWSVNDSPRVLAECSNMQKWVCLKIVYPIVPNGFHDQYPVFKWLFHWEYIPYFQTNPNIHQQCTKITKVSLRIFLRHGINRLGIVSTNDGSFSAPAETPVLLWHHTPTCSSCHKVSVGQVGPWKGYKNL